MNNFNSFNSGFLLILELVRVFVIRPSWTKQDNRCNLQIVLLCLWIWRAYEWVGGSTQSRRCTQNRH